MSEVEIKWAIVRTYYKHAEYELLIVSDESLRGYLLGELGKYLDFSEIENVSEKSMSELIEYAVESGNERVENQSGWGIREIKMV